MFARDHSVRISASAVIVRDDGQCVQCRCRVAHQISFFLYILQHPLTRTMCSCVHQEKNDIRKLKGNATLKHIVLPSKESMIQI